MECDLADLAISMLAEFEEKGLHTDRPFRPYDRPLSLPLWAKWYGSSICAVGFMADHINLTISYESKLDPTYPNPRKIFEYCNPAFPGNLYEFVEQRTKAVMDVWGTWKSEQVNLA